MILILDNPYGGTISLNISQISTVKPAEAAEMKGHTLITMANGDVIKVKQDKAEIDTMILKNIKK